jgi:hypothetical protein
MLPPPRPDRRGRHDPDPVLRFRRPARPDRRAQASPHRGSPGQAGGHRPPGPPPHRPGRPGPSGPRSTPAWTRSSLTYPSPPAGPPVTRVVSSRRARQAAGLTEHAVPGSGRRIRRLCAIALRWPSWRGYEHTKQIVTHTSRSACLPPHRLLPWHKTPSLTASPSGNTLPSGASAGDAGGVG